MYIKVREDYQVVYKSVYLAQGVRDDIYREVVNFQVYDKET